MFAHKKENVDAYKASGRGTPGASAQQTLVLCFACGREVWSLGGAVNGRQDMVGGNSRLVGWMDG
jgi:hypothetical protein